MWFQIHGWNIQKLVLYFWEYRYTVDFNMHILLKPVLKCVFWYVLKTICEVIAFKNEALLWFLPVLSNGFSFS